MPLACDRPTLCVTECQCMGAVVEGYRTNQEETTPRPVEAPLDATPHLAQKP